MSTINEGEINRLKRMPDDYDEQLFNHYFRTMKPLVKKLVKQIDARRFNVPPDIIHSWFYDKLLYVFNKYYNISSENPEKFKATIISSLLTYKNRVLRNAYSKQSTDFFQITDRLDDCFGGDKDDSLGDLEITTEESRDILTDVYEFMKLHCSHDAYVLFQIQMSPPTYIKEKLKSINSIISTSIILEYFEKPVTQSYISYITSLRKEISDATDKAREYFNHISV